MAQTLPTLPTKPKPATVTPVKKIIPPAKTEKITPAVKPQSNSYKLTLKIEANDNCDIYIDNEKKFSYKKDDIIKIYFAKGEYKIKAVRSGNSADVFSEIYTVNADDLNSEKFYSITLPITVNIIEQKAAAEKEIKQAMVYYESNNYPTAFAIFNKYVNTSYLPAEAMKDLGYMYKNGYGVTIDYSQAVKWYLKSANMGNAKAQNNLGTMYEKGLDVILDYSEAVKWYSKSAAQGNAIAQFNLGDMYENGKGVFKDFNEAVKWYRKSAELGNKDAADRLKMLGE